jgi:glycosyltransferase involved in cell wall biosynthesis
MKPIRILHVIAALAPGGVETLVRGLAIEMQLRKNVQSAIAYIDSAADQGRDPSFEANFLKRLSDAGIPTYELGNHTRKNVLLGVIRFRGVVANFCPNLIHIHLGYGALFRALSWLDVPTIYTNHYVTSTFPASLFRWFDRTITEYVSICRECDVFLKRVTKKPVTLIYNGSSSGVSRPPRGPPNGQHFRLLSVGSLTPRKNFPMLIDVMEAVSRELQKEGRSIVCDIAGSGECLDELKDLVCAKKLVGVVNFLGQRSDIEALMNAADAIIMTSKGEGFPITLIEAAHAALPMIATDVGGCREIVSDGLNGYLVPDGGSELMVQRLLKLIHEPDSYVAFSKKATESAQIFSLANCVTRHEALYARLAKA